LLSVCFAYPSERLGHVFLYVIDIIVFMKAIRIFLLVLIIIGLGLLITQKIWVPKLVAKIIAAENK